MPGDGASNGNLTIYVAATCMIAAMYGLILGYDIAISGGITSVDHFLKKFFPSEYRKQKASESTGHYCTSDSLKLTMFTSSLYLAVLVSFVVAGMVMRRMGIKTSMLLGGMLSFLGALLNSLAQSLWMLILGRLLLGLGVGFTYQSVPLYLSEMAPYKYRGALNIGFQFSITFGVLVANILNWVFAKIMKKGLGWRFSLGAVMVPAVIITLVSLILPETPTSLIKRGNLDKAREMLVRIRGLPDVDIELQELVAANEASQLVVEHPWRNLLRRKYRPYLTMAIAFPLFQQLTGINMILLYAPVLFKTIGFGSEASFYFAVVMGSLNVLATVASTYSGNKWGRRVLFLIGGILMLICLIVLSISIGLKFGMDGEPAGNVQTWYGVMVALLICIYVAVFAWSWGQLDWLLPIEIFPLEIRSAAKNLNVCVNMISTFIVVQVFSPMLCNLKFGLFLFFGVLVLVMTGFIYLFLPETKNIRIEEMVVVWRGHWFWSRFMTDEDYPSNGAVQG